MDAGFLLVLVAEASPADPGGLLRATRLGRWQGPAMRPEQACRRRVQVHKPSGEPCPTRAPPRTCRWGRDDSVR